MILSDHLSAAFSRQYVQSLESRVQALEAFQARALPVVVRAETQKDEPVAPAVVPPVVVPSPAADTRFTALETQSHSAPDGQSAKAPDEPIEDIGHMARDANGTMRWIGASSTLTLMSSFAGGKSREGSDDGSEDIQDEVENSASHSTSRDRERQPANPYYAPVAGAGVVKALPTVRCLLRHC